MAVVAATRLDVRSIACILACSSSRDDDGIADCSPSTGCTSRTSKERIVLCTCVRATGVIHVRISRNMCNSQTSKSGCVLVKRQRNPFCKIHQHIYSWRRHFPTPGLPDDGNVLMFLFCCCFRHWVHLGHKTLLLRGQEVFYLSLSTTFVLIPQEP